VQIKQGFNPLNGTMVEWGVIFVFTWSRFVVFNCHNMEEGEEVLQPWKRSGCSVRASARGRRPGLGWACSFGTYGSVYFFL
jgi:hypothetical protein